MPQPTAVPTAPTGPPTPTGPGAGPDLPTQGQAPVDGRRGTAAVGEDAAERRRPGLSPSRAADFLQCPLLFRFRVVDRLPEPPNAAAVRGTLVHAVLERLYDLPRGERTRAAATALLAPTWDELVAAEPELAALVDEDLDAWLAPAADLLATYFTLEDPNRLEPAEREATLRTALDDDLELRGVVDRIDVAPDGRIRIVDYKTGRAPGEAFEASAMFQLRVYALLVERLRGRVPAMLQLLYLGDGTVLRHQPDESDVRSAERRVRAIWSAVRTAAVRDQWQPRRTALCGWCAHRALCPVFGGTPPEVDPGAVERALGVRPQTATTS